MAKDSKVKQKVPKIHPAFLIELYFWEPLQNAENF